GVTEHLPHFLFGHGAEAASGTAPHVDAPTTSLRSATRARSGTGLLVHPPVRAELIVLFPLLRVAQNFVRLVDVLELGFRRLVVRVDVRMVLARDLSDRLLDFLVRCRFGHAKRGVVVLEFHGQSKPSMRLSSSSS